MVEFRTTIASNSAFAVWLSFIAYREIFVKTLAFRVDLRFASCKSVFCKVLQGSIMHAIAKEL